MRDHDSSGNVTAGSADRQPPETAPSGATATAARAADDALRLAITLAVEAGDYERASAILEIAKRSASGRPC